MSLTLGFHGAARTVTGSCMELHNGHSRILVDCGLFQGSRSLEALNYQPLGFNPKQIDAVLLTHAHIDHSGLLPRLVAEGFSGDIWCTAESSELLEFMLADSGRIHENEAKRRNRRRDRAGEEPIEPIYTESQAMDAWRRTRSIPLGEWFDPAPGFRSRLWNAGHILGSASIEIEANDVHLFFSGDLGPDNKAFHPDPSGPSGFDYVVSESTYGDRTRPVISIEERRELLEAEIGEARSKGGNLIIPAFALERTQELLLDLAVLSRTGRTGGAVIYVDSPLANRATGVFEKHFDQLEDTGGICVFDDPAIHYVNDTSESIRLNSVTGAIIIAASGMCEGGRIRHHLLHNLHRRDSTILFTGYQAEGTLGRVILEGARHVRISGQEVRVRAGIRRIESYSAHADQSELLHWIGERGPITGSLFLDHGEDGALRALRQLVGEAQFASSVIVPEIGEVYELKPGKQASRRKTGRTDILGRDWQNEYAALAGDFKSKLIEIRDTQARQEAIAKMRDVLESYAEHKSRKSRS